MTIDKVIEKYKTMSTKGNIMFPQRPDIAEASNLQYKQTAEWLEELKRLRLGVNYLNEKAYQQGYADAITEFDRICEETRSHNFGVCDADFVIDVIKAKVKEQLKEQTE